MQTYSRMSSAPLMLLRLVVVALVIGLVMFVGMLLAVGFAPKADAPFLGSFLTYTAIGISLVAIAINIVFWTRAKQPAIGSDSSRGYATLALRTIGGAIVFTFAGFFAAIAMMLEESPAALILVVAMIVGIASRFPIKAGAAEASSGTPGNAPS